MLVAASHNSGNNGAPAVDMAKLKRTERISCGRSTVLLTAGLRLRPQGNKSFDSGLRRIVLSSQNRCVVAANVM